MAIDFPASPSLNDTFTSGGVTYTWDGTVWVASGSAAFALKAGDTFAGNVEIGTGVDLNTDGSATFAGDVGIGNSSPTELLSVGNTTDSDNYIRINSANNSEAGVKFYGDLGATKGYTVGYEGDGNSFFIRSDNAGTVDDRLVINDSGDVGIGKTDPTQKLDITGNGFIGNGDYPWNASNESGIFLGSGRIDQYKRDDDTSPFFSCIPIDSSDGSLGTAAFIVNNAGNVGIGTTSTSARLTVVNNSGTGAINLADFTAATDGQNPLVRIVGRNAANTGTTSVDFYKEYQGGFRLINNDTDSSNFTSLEVGGSERMRLDSAGQVNVFANATSHISRSGTGAGTVEWLYAGAHSATSTSDGTISFRVHTNGNVQNTNNSYGAISDETLKENIVPASDQWDNIKDIEVVNYNFKEETGHETHKQLGVIAQQVEEVSPGLVNTDEDGLKSVNYSVLYMKSVKALQEAMERIETLEAQNTDLVARIEALEQA